MRRKPSTTRSRATEKALQRESLSSAKYHSTLSTSQAHRGQAGKGCPKRSGSEGCPNQKVSFVNWLAVRFAQRPPNFEEWKQLFVEMRLPSDNYSARKPSQILRMQ